MSSDTAETREEKTCIPKSSTSKLGNGITHPNGENIRERKCVCQRDFLFNQGVSPLFPYPESFWGKKKRNEEKETARERERYVQRERERVGGAKWTASKVERVKQTQRKIQTQGKTGSTADRKAARKRYRVMEMEMPVELWRET